MRVPAWGGGNPHIRGKPGEQRPVSPGAILPVVWLHGCVERLPEPVWGKSDRAGHHHRRKIMALSIVEKESDGVQILQLSGRVTLGEESNQLRTKLKEALSEGKTRLVLDLAEVTYIDSAGLGTLVAGFTSAQNQGANLKLANLTKRFREQLNITKLVTVFDVYDSVEDAVKSFGSAS
jgi:anti-sigma B factor antagonist